MTPDKIYVHEISAEELTKNLPYHICYIRMDALLEWLKEKEQNAITNIVKLTYRTVIDKIEPL